ncbi:MAG TPA: hypothetical protein PK691_00115 [Thermomicrobiales bacterium]|nr:hypothetical protein [Thermomicrobiales bacterium]HRA46752.1 hypothetical protein [Thermomicrobiales bacterium]
MTTVDLTAVEQALRQAMLNHAEPGEFDLTTDPPTNLIELATDDWTLQVDGSGPELVAWFAIDNEPDTAAEYPAAIHNTLRSAERIALAEADLNLGGVLAAAMQRSGDPLSQFLSKELAP